MNFYYYMDKPLKYCKSCFIYAYTHTYPERLMGQKVQCKITKLPVHTAVMEKVTNIMATLQSVAQ